MNKDDYKPKENLDNIKPQSDASTHDSENKLVEVKKDEGDDAKFKINQKPAEEQQLEEED